MEQAIKIDAVGIVCTLQPGGRYVGVTTAQGRSIAFFVTDEDANEDGFDVAIAWCGVRIEGAGCTLDEAYADVKDTAASFVPRLHAELVALEWSAYVARREERQAREAEAEDERENQA